MLMGGSRVLRWWFVLCLWLCFCVACDQLPLEGYFPRVDTEGPTILFDWEAQPLPVLPFPNDLLTKLDQKAFTGRSLDLSVTARVAGHLPTKHEEAFRRQLNTLDGFGLTTPITVRFDKPLDLAAIIKRHKDNRDFQDDAVFVVCIDRDAPTFGRPVLLDMGQGRFPLVLKSQAPYFPYDSHTGAGQLLFETRGEQDTNGNGKLDPQEDLDGDGVWDKPNTFPPNTTGPDSWLNWYERETNTLIMRPVLPLLPGRQYAVILTKRLTGEQGTPIKSPFAWGHHLAQKEGVGRLVVDQILTQLGLEEKDLAFVWTFTTQRSHQDLEQLRNALVGRGPFRTLNTRLQPQVTSLHPLTTKGEAPWRLPGTALPSLADTLLPLTNEDAKNARTKSLQSIDYLISGTYRTHDLLAPRNADGEVVGDDSNAAGVVPRHLTTFQLSHSQETVLSGLETVTWWCSLPKATGTAKPPFPVVLMPHRARQSRLALLSFAGAFAQHGLAMCTIDGPGHGWVVPKAKREALSQALAKVDLQPVLGALEKGRARDLTGDGQPDSGADLWVGHPFHSRDLTRQSVLDYMMFVRIMRTWDGNRTWSLDTNKDGQPELTGLAGDFNGDGVVDMGGPAGSFSTWGQAWGGVVASLLAATEPAITAVAAVATAGLLQRKSKAPPDGLMAPFYLHLMGPLVLGEANTEGRLSLRFLVRQGAQVVSLPFAVTKATLAEGDKVALTNTKTGQRQEALIRTREGKLTLRLAVATDALDGLSLVVYKGTSEEIKEEIKSFTKAVTFQGQTYQPGASLVALASGWGLQRQTPAFRRLLAWMGAAQESADPLNYAPLWHLRPLHFSYEQRLTTGANALVMPLIGSQSMPVDASVAVARAAGIVPTLAADPRYPDPQTQGAFLTPDEVLIRSFVLEGVAHLKRFVRASDQSGILFDPDRLSQGKDGFNAPGLLYPLRLQVPTAGGVAAMRLPYVAPTGADEIGPPTPQQAFDIHTFVHNQIARFLKAKGTTIDDRLCLADDSCQ